MEVLPRDYPAHPWIADWRLEAREKSSSAHEWSACHFFKTLETVGRVAPDVESPEWSLQVPVPQNSRINLLFNGFGGCFNQRRRILSAEALVPEAGVLWGRFRNIPAPVLIAESDIERGDGFEWFEGDAVPALLAVRAGMFCLVTKDHMLQDALAVAERYFALDFQEGMRKELALRAGAARLFEHMPRHDALAVLGTEALMRALRPPEGKIARRWSQMSGTATARLSVNQVHPLALAWRHIDVAVAEDIVEGALRLQTSAGAIPVEYSPHESASVIEAPKPLLAKTAEKVWMTGRNAAFLDAIVPLLRRHIQWLLQHFDPKRRGLHCWQNSNEPLISGIYQSEMATVDLTALLVTEIDSLNRLREQSPACANDAPYFPNERAVLANNLQTQFWNDEAGEFCNAFVRGALVAVRGFIALTPLLWSSLPPRRKSAMIDRIKETGVLPGGLSMLSWRKSVADEDSFSLLHMTIALEALEMADPHGSLPSDFARLGLERLVEWHSLALQENGRIVVDTMTASLIVNLQQTRNYRFAGKGRLLSLGLKLVRRGRIDRLDLAVVAVCLLTMFSIHAIYRVLHSPPPLAMLEARMNGAFARHDVDTLVSSCQAIMKYYPKQSGNAKLMAGNVFMLNKRFEEALPLFEDLCRTNPDSPGPMISLGLACQLTGRFEEAERKYAEFCYLFDEIFPEIVATIQRNRDLLREGLRSPPNWADIYRYQLMNEL